MGRIRGAMYGTVAAVAVFAAVVSYAHIYALGRDHGPGGRQVAPWLLPLSVDGLIVAASLLMLHEALSGRQAPLLARVMLISGIAATVGANVAWGLGWGVAGAVIWAWPAYAFVGSVELLIILVRRASQAAAEASPGPFPAPVPTSAQSAAAMAFEATWRAGNPLSQRQLADRFGLTRGEARAICAQFIPELAGVNGDGS